MDNIILEIGNRFENGLLFVVVGDNEAFRLFSLADEVHSGSSNVALVDRVSGNVPRGYSTGRCRQQTGRTREQTGLLLATRKNKASDLRIHRVVFLWHGGSICICMHIRVT